MKRVNLYFDEDVWSGIKKEASKIGLSVSAYVRMSVAERIQNDDEKRKYKKRKKGNITQY